MALESGARVVATGRSDFPNQVNNAIVFPSILRALLDIRSKVLDEQMLVSVAHAIAGMVDETHLRKEYIIPKINDPRILPTVNRTLRDGNRRSGGRPRPPSGRCSWAAWPGTLRYRAAV